MQMIRLQVLLVLALLVGGCTRPPVPFSAPVRVSDSAYSASAEYSGPDSSPPVTNTPQGQLIYSGTFAFYEPPARRSEVGCLWLMEFPNTPFYVERGDVGRFGLVQYDPELHLRAETSVHIRVTCDPASSRVTSLEVD